MRCKRQTSPRLINQKLFTSCSCVLLLLCAYENEFFFLVVKLLFEIFPRYVSSLQYSLSHQSRYKYNRLQTFIMYINSSWQRKSEEGYI